MSIFSSSGIISTYASLIPLVAGLSVFKRAGNNLRLLFLFVGVGFLTDIAVWLLMRDFGLLAKLLFEGYSLIEALFLLLILRRLSLSHNISRLIKIFFFPFILFWVFSEFTFFPFGLATPSHNTIFVIVYEIPISFLSGFLLLTYIEKNKRPFELPDFWVICGIFFYCFTSFFITAFMETSLLKSVWWVHNMINIITYLIYTYGFYKVAANRAD